MSAASTPLRTTAAPASGPARSAPAVPPASGRHGNPALHLAPRCGARTRAGCPCRAPAIAGKRRCRMHGGRSTGPRTQEGLARLRAARTSPEADALFRAHACHVSSSLPPQPGAAHRHAAPRPAAGGPRGTLPPNAAGIAVAALPDTRDHGGAGPRPAAGRCRGARTVEAGHRASEAGGPAQRACPGGSRRQPGRRDRGIRQSETKTPCTRASPGLSGSTRAGQGTRRSGRKTLCTCQPRRLVSPAGAGGGQSANKSPCTRKPRGHRRGVAGNSGNRTPCT